MGIDCHAVARQLALGLAVGHWVAQHDMTDVEFVIAGRHKPAIAESRAQAVPLDDYDRAWQQRNRNMVPESQRKQHGLPADTQMWLVDFDKCNRVRVWDDTLAQDIRKLALGICANDPYYPSPLPDTRLGWDIYLTFTRTYIDAGCHLLRRAFEKVATSDDQLQKVLERPAMVMVEWTKVDMRGKRNNERDVFDKRMDLRKKEGWRKPDWCAHKM